jgi:hypothetical protein
MKKVERFRATVNRTFKNGCVDIITVSVVDNTEGVVYEHKSEYMQDIYNCIDYIVRSKDIYGDKYSCRIEYNDYYI